MNYMIACFVAGLVSAAFSDYRTSGELERNEVNGYHCQPITEHKTLEEAKARIEQYQAMVRG